MNLLYTLEKVKVASKPEYGCFHTFEGTQEDADCKALEADGLIRKIIDEDDHRAWRYE